MRHQTTPLFALPMHITPPPAAEVEVSAKSSPLVATLSRLREYLGSDGRALSAAHGLRFGDVRELAEIFGLPVIANPDEPGADGVAVSPGPEPRCTLALAIALESGAVEEVGNRLFPGRSWDDETATVQAAVALSTLIELGPMWTSVPRGEPFIDLRDSVLDAVYINWLVTLLPTEQTQCVDHFVNWGVDVCREQIGGDPFPRRDELEMWIDNATCYLVDTLVWAGAIEWCDQQVRTHDLAPDTKWFGGGSIRLTALGRHVLPDHLASAGLKLRDPDEAGTQSAAGLLGDILVADEAARRDLVSAWRRDLDDAERARLVAEVLLDMRYSPLRIAGFEVLELIGPDVAAAYVRQLLDSPASESAAQFLVTHGLAHGDELDPFIGYGPLIDALASVAARPDRLRASFVRLLEQTEAPELLLEVIALYPTPEATMLLTAAARHVTDPRFAKLICAAEQYHHECLAERDPAL